MKVHWMLCLALMAVLGLVVGCGGDKGKTEGGDASKEGGSGGGAAASAEPDEGASSPQKAFEGIKNALKDGKMSGAMLKYVEPGERYGMLLGMYLGAAMMAAFDEEMKPKIEKIIEKYDLPEEKEGEEEFSMEDLQDKAKVREYGAKIFADVDVEGLFEDLMALMQESGEGGEKEMQPVGVSDIKIEGDKAKGVMEMEDGKKEDIHFVKVDGAWFVVMDPQEDEEEDE